MLPVAVLLMAPPITTPFFTEVVVLAGTISH